MTRLNILGILGALIAFISLVVPWWTMTLTFSFMGIDRSAHMSLYLYQAETSAVGWSASSHLDLWFGWIALVLVVLGGLLGAVGSLRQQGRLVLVGGVFAVISVTVFAVGLQSELWNAPVNPWGYSVPWLFSSGLIDQGGLSHVSYTAYLSFGFWMALVAAVAMLVASLQKVVQSSPQPPSPS